jgi:glycosyltransferase involved in cell wall biosynthesis
VRSGEGVAVRDSIVILIPAYNAAETLTELVERCGKSAPGLRIVVVDDGSTDSTAGVLRDLDVAVLTHQQNRGKGEALKTGFNYAADNGFDAVITLDADLQHVPEAIPDFVRLYQTGDYDLIIGTRRISLSIMPFARWVSNKTTSSIITRMTGQNITDSQSGYRLVSTALWHEIELSTAGYDLESEVLIKAGKRGYRIGEIPIKTIYTGSKSYINPVADSWRFIKLVWRNFGS